MEGMYPSFFCQVSGHQQQPISYFCIEQQCQGDRLLCVLCSHYASHPCTPEQPHHSHQCKPIKYFISMITQDLKALDSSTGYLAKIDKLKYQMQQKLSEQALHKQQNILNMLKISIQQYFNRIDTQCEISSVNKIKNKMQVGCSREMFAQLLKQYYKLWIRYYNQQNKNQSIYYILLQTLIEDLTAKINIMDQKIKSKEIDISLVEIFKEESSSKKFYFSSKLLHSALTFQSKTKIKISGYADYNYFALCEPALSMNKVQRVTFKMTYISSYITMGICIKNKIQGNYQFMSDGIGHGSYQISYDGYLWSDHDSTVNSTYSGWYYNAGDTVTLQFDPKSKSLKFIRNGDQTNTKTLNYEISKADKLHFCISMNSQPEEVDIVD